MKTELYHISRGIARSKDYPVWFVANILKETAKAVYLYGRGTTKTTKMGICCRCGRKLTHPVSVLLGIGPECGEHYHNWDLVGGYSVENLERLKTLVQEIQIDGWIPKACILERFDTEDHVETPEDHPMVKRTIKSEEEKKKEEGSVARSATLVWDIDGTPRIQIRFPFNHDDVAKIKTIPGKRFHRENTTWTCPVSIDALTKLGDWGFKLDQSIKDHLKKIQVNIKDVSDNIQIPGLKKELMPFQKKGVAYLEARNGRAILGDDMGLGKTVQALAWLQLHPELRPAVVVCPANAKFVWKNHIRDWMSTGDTVQVISGSKPGDVYGDIIIINYDILGNTFKTKINELTGKKEKIEIPRTGWVDYILDQKPQVLIADECHYFKDDGANRTRAIKKMAPRIPHFIPTSGTFIINRPMEGYNAINLVEPALFPSRFKFGIEFCNGQHNGYGWDFTGSSNTQKLHDLLRETMMIRRKKSEVLTELPDKLVSFVPLELPDSSEYWEADDNFIDWVKQNYGAESAGRAKTAEGLTRFGYLKQLASREKMPQVVDWIRDHLDSNGKLVVFAIYKETINTIMEAFKGISVKIDGSVPASKRDAIAQQFQTDDSIRLFVGNVRAACESITLTASSSVAFVELPWAPGHVSQASDRCHRIGQKDTVNIYYLVVADSVEEDVAEIIDTKRVVLDAVLDGVETDEESLFRDMIETYKNNKED